jgi:multicomponent Na+:H+ antiporter subunit E
MNPFSINLVLAVVWAALSGGFTIAGLLTGFVLGFVTLWIMQPLFPQSRYCSKTIGIVRLALFFLWELLVSSIRVAWSVIVPLRHSKPGIVSVPLDVVTDTEITVLGNLISLTPGSLSLDISPDRRHLIVHAMFIEDPDDFRRELKRGMEHRVREALRP